MTVTLTIDGRRVEAPAGSMLLEAARSAGIEIPSLCVHEALEPWGGCRLCMVEIARPSWGDHRKLVTSCLYPVEEGLAVYTNTERVQEVRRTVLDLLLARAPGSTELAELARRHGVYQSSFAAVPEADDCINCGLCTRICESLGPAAIGSASRGKDRRVATPFDEPSAACTGCLACALICPTRNIPFEEAEGARRIWGREFTLVPCARCGRATLTAEQVAYHMRLSNLPHDYFELCDACRRSQLAVVLGEISAWVPEEVDR